MDRVSSVYGQKKHASIYFTHFILGSHEDLFPRKGKMK